MHIRAEEHGRVVIIGSLQSLFCFCSGSLLASWFLCVSAPGAVQSVLGQVLIFIEAFVGW